MCQRCMRKIALSVGPILPFKIAVGRLNEETEMWAMPAENSTPLAGVALLPHGP